MDDLCTACLCTGRRLYFIGETGSYHLYSQIINEIPVYDLSDVSIRVCFECRALLRRFREFKLLVKKSYTDLLTQLHQNCPPTKSSLARPSRLSIQNAATCSYPELFLPIKEEVEVDYGVPLEDVDSTSVKEECYPDHSEPEAEAFVEDVIVKKIKKKKTNRKTGKDKTKKKTKTTSKKLEEKKINTKKKAEDSHSVSSADKNPFLSDALAVTVLNDDGIDDEEDVSLDVVRKEEQLKEKQEKALSINKRKKTDVETNGEDVQQVEKPPKKANGAIPKEKNPEPEMVGDKPKCGECGKIFSSKKTYRYHLNVLHKGQNRYPCPRCGKVYQWKSNLGRHLRTHKARDSGELYCETCDKRFASVATYRQHLRVSRRHVSETEFSFICNDCGKKFVSKTRLRDHVDWEHLHNIKFRCQLCNKPFKCHTSLYVHMQNVHRNKKKENLCHICGKSYQNAAKLKYHIVAMHTSETPYQCAQCAAAFGWYSSLYRHVREVHYKMKLQPKRMRKAKRTDLPPLPPHELAPPPQLL